MEEYNEEEEKRKENASLIFALVCTGIIVVLILCFWEYALALLLAPALLSLGGIFLRK